MFSIFVLSLVGTMSYGAAFSNADSCRADFVYSTQNGTVAFVDSSSSTSSIVAYTWNFGDGTSSNLKNPTHSYASGIYQANVCLTVKNQLNISATICKTVTVRSVDSCYAGFSYTYTKDSIGSGYTFYFTDMSSSNVINRTWSFGDGTYSSLQNPSHTYNIVPGASVDVSLRVYTATGCYDTVYRTITVPNITPEPCHAAFSYYSIKDSTGTGITVQFTDMSSSNVVSRLWNFGDGTYSTLKNPSHRYTLSPGSQVTVSEYITTSSMCHDSVSQVVYIPYDVPTDTCNAHFTYYADYDSVATGVTVYFTDMSSSNVISRFWDFGDSISSTLMNPVHHYNLPSGSVVNVREIISTSFGCVDTFSTTIYINGQNHIDTCYAGFTYVQDSTVSSGFGYHFTNTSSASATNWYWDFGDGTSSVLQNPSHVYHLPAGTQVSVGLTINTSMNCTDSAFTIIAMPNVTGNYLISGKVTAKSGVLSSGIIVLYKKNSMGRFILKDANVITDGVFKFEHLDAGKYIVCAIPDINNSGIYLPTYYVSSLHWATANVIDLKSNAQGLTLKMIGVKSFGIGSGSISGNVIDNTYDTYSAESNLKSVTQITYNVYLYSESGEVISAVTPDASGKFNFESLPYGNYSLNVEYPNLESSNMTVSLTPATPTANNVQFRVDHNALSVNPVKDANEITVYYVSAGEVAVRVREAGKYSVSVVSITGSTLYHNSDVNFDANVDKIIDLSGIPSGTYLLKLQNNKGVLVKKLAK
jgi:PKD repeat protein